LRKKIYDVAHGALREPAERRLGEIMGTFGRMVADAKPNEGGVFWLPGTYLVQIDVVKVVNGRKGLDYFIVEGENLESTSTERAVGTHASWVSSLEMDSTPGNVQLFIAAAMNCPKEEVDEEAAELVISPDNPLHGRLVRLEVALIKTRAGNDFSKHVWRPVPDEIQAKAAELRAKAGFPPF
jgi:hypothetical protein